MTDTVTIGNGTLMYGRVRMAAPADVWESADGGSSWRQLSSRAQFAPRDGAFAAVVNDSLVLTGGFAGQTFFNDTWISETGVDWAPVTTSGDEWVGRSFFGAAVLPRERLLVLGGWLDGWGPGSQICVANDVLMLTLM